MVSETTRARILEAVNRLGYVANGAARALAMRRTMTIGAVVPRFGSSSFPTMVPALESTLAAQRYTLLLAAPEHHTAQEPLISRALLERGLASIPVLAARHTP